MGAKGFIMSVLFTAFLMTLMEEMGFYRNAPNIITKFIISLAIVLAAKIVGKIFS